MFNFRKINYYYIKCVLRYNSNLREFNGSCQQYNVQLICMYCFLFLFFFEKVNDDDQLGYRELGGG